MKKIILILLLALFSFSMNAQTVLKKSVTDEYIMVESVDTIDTINIQFGTTVTALDRFGNAHLLPAARRREKEHGYQQC